MSGTKLSPIAPFTHGAAVTKSDSTVLAPTRALYIGGVGDVTVIMKDGASVLFTAVPTGTMLHVSVTKVMSTGTGATAIAALY